MENYSFTSYPDSGESSLCSHKIDFENPPWDDQPHQNYKAKFMCSYGGKIHPHPHDNQLSKSNDETKILAINCTVKFNSFISKLSALCAGGADSDMSFKYQLPDEDLDALILARVGAKSTRIGTYRETRKKMDTAPTHGQRRRSHVAGCGAHFAASVHPRLEQA
nr:hypothetical protein CFP56_27645 [Quercus suber]